MEDCSESGGRSSGEVSEVMNMFERFPESSATINDYSCRTSNTYSDNRDTNTASESDTRSPLEQYDHNEVLSVVIVDLLPPRLKTFINSKNSLINSSTTTASLHIRTTTTKTILSSILPIISLNAETTLDLAFNIDDISPFTNFYTKMISITSYMNSIYHGDDKDNDVYYERDSGGGRGADDTKNTIELYNFCPLTYAPSNRQRTKTILNTAMYLDNERRLHCRSNYKTNHLIRDDANIKISRNENILDHVLNRRALPLLKLSLLRKWKCRIYTSLLIMLLLILTIHLDTISADQGIYN